MYYKVIKSGCDGISGAEYQFQSIDEVCHEVFDRRGWDSLEQLHAAIRKWAEIARPGDMFTTQVMAIVAVGSLSIADDDCCPSCGHDYLDYGDFSMVKDGNVEQEIECPKCGWRWKDIFIFVESCTLASSE